MPHPTYADTAPDPQAAKAALLRRVRDLLHREGLGEEFTEDQNQLVDLSDPDDGGEILIDGLGTSGLIALTAEQV